MTEKSAIDFLFFSYFNEDIDEIKEDKSKLLNAAINRAYRDAASHVLKFEFNNSLSDKEKSKIINTYKTIGEMEILNYLTNISDKKEKLSENWVEELAKELIALYGLSREELISKIDTVELKSYQKENGEFTFGIAQKWINMTMKNIYVMDSIIKTYLKKEKTCLGYVCDVFDKFIDVPVDDYIIKATCNRFLEKVPSKNSEKKDGNYMGNSDKYSEKLAWSNWKNEYDAEYSTKSYYRAFQERLKRKMDEDDEFKEMGDVLDKENRLWINTAKGLYDKKKKMNN